MATISDSPKKTFDVAVVGGGIAGLALAIGLLNHKIPVTVYESAHNFGEIGAGVFFYPNAVEAMNGIDKRITAGFQKVANFNYSPELKDVYFDYRIGEGERAGELIARPKCPGPHAGVHRARFLDELIKIVPEGVAHFGRRLTKLESTSDNKLKLTFKDGGVATHDCVIGSDGVHSIVRPFVLGADDPAAFPVFSGGYCHRGLIPMEKARDFLGEEMAMNCQSHIGHGSHLLTFPVDDYRTFNAVAFSHCEKWEEEKWVVPGSVKDIQKDFKDFGKPGQEIIKRMENTDIWAIYHHLPAKTFVRGPVALIGDAAHCTTPYQGNGAGFSIEDSYVLSELIGYTSTLPDPYSKIARCLEAYNSVRHERGLRLVQTSKEAGMLWNMSDPECGDDYEKIAERAEGRWGWIWGVDHEADINKGKAIIDDS